ncbi:MAG TPA: NAD-dependent succinate-semialdehyde dehydrogenase [Pseudonocardiaceae bacterium]|nr:NAD-dependent succinate-semialdehyde dehydrogenase [Pseudonocardiaceae bacterium]
MTTVAATEAAVDYPDLRLLVDGQWRGSAVTSPVVDPATEQVIAEVPHATTDDMDAALAAAARGFDTWRRTPVTERAAVMREAARLVRERSDRFARVITRELGKPLAEARVEVGTAVGILEWNADEGRRTYGRVIPGPANRRQFVQAEPIGPVAAFAPWNAPLITPSRKISSALAAGCSVVIKPAEETPGTAVLLAQAYLDAGLPAGVLNVLFGEPAAISQRLLTSDVIRAVTFTGSTAVGRSLAGTAALHMKRAVMELGGHAPVLVCDDVSVDEVAAGAARAAYRNAGQVCTSPTRFFVARSRYAEFLDALTDRVGALKLGNGFDADTDVGPLANERRVAAIDHLVTDAVRHDARVTTGGRRGPGPGYFWEPTVLADVADACEVSRVEPFGPLATVAAFDDLDTAIRRANSVPFGLAGYVFSNDAATVRKLGAEIDCGAIAVNHWQVSGPETPFGGHKDSGFGSEGGIEGISAFQQLKFLSEQ